MIKHIKYIIATFFICLVLQFFAYCIPQKMIMENVLESSYLLKDGGIYTLAPDYYSLRIDTFTDSWMMNIASWSGNEPILEKALGAYYYDFASIPTEGGRGPWLALTEISNGNYNLQRGSYARYWHGYIFFLKLALTVMNYSDIRVLNFFILFSLFAYLFYTLANENKQCCIPFAISIMILCPLSTFFCMAYTGVIFISLLSSIILIKQKWWDKNRSLLYISFVVIGMLTAWIDVLSFPLLTLGIPLIFVVCYWNTTTYKDAICSVLILSICWTIGYAGMWAMKWILSSMVLGTNVVADALGAARVRASKQTVGDHTPISLIDVIIETWKILNKKAYLIMVVVGIIYTLKKWRFNIMKVHDKKKALQLLIIAIYPIGWCFAMTEHTYEHSLFTFRIWGITTFALLSILCVCIQKRKLKEKANV